jgi:hypothetical protein
VVAREWRNEPFRSRSPGSVPIRTVRPFWGPSGASVWKAPTVDPKRGLLYEPGDLERLSVREISVVKHLLLKRQCVFKAFLIGFGLATFRHGRLNQRRAARTTERQARGLLKLMFLDRIGRQCRGGGAKGKQLTKAAEAGNSSNFNFR